MASSIRDRIHRLRNQKTTLTHLPAQISRPRLLVLPSRNGARTARLPVRGHGPGLSLGDTGSCGKETMSLRGNTDPDETEVHADLASAADTLLSAP